MGFFGVMGRILAGKPAFEPGDSANKNAPLQPTAPASGGALPHGPKQIPQLRLGRIENFVRDGRYELYVDIVNESSDQVFLDNITLLGARHELDIQLRAGETRQCVVYSARPLTNPASGYAQMQYRKQADGDYFIAYFEIRSRRESDGFFKVSEFRPTGPIKDI